MNKKHFPNTDTQRATNLRQRILKASRTINTAIVEGLHQRGYKELRSTHTALLSNLDIEGSNLTNIAQRAGMTKQAMGRLADELIKFNYIVRIKDDTDKRALKLMFTPEGLNLMKQSFIVISKIEQRCSTRIGEEQFNMLLNSLEKIVDELEDN